MVPFPVCILHLVDDNCPGCGLMLDRITNFSVVSLLIVNSSIVNYLEDIPHGQKIIIVHESTLVYQINCAIVVSLRVKSFDQSDLLSRVTIVKQTQVKPLEQE